MKKVSITATATAEIQEVWVYEVPDEWEPGDDNENASDLLGGELVGTRFVSCDDRTTGNETDRQITNIEFWREEVTP